jgi:Mn2+/Fe2+ NRAMP family transporter
MNWLYAASLLSGITALVHIFGGGKTVAKPLLASSMEDEAKYTNYYCWHMVTIIIISMTICFFLAARNEEYRELAVLSSALSLAFAVWSCFLIYLKNQKPFVLPQWVLFFPIAILGAIGVFQIGV